jgi:nicotinamide riboside transporter PnuC
VDWLGSYYGADWLGMAGSVVGLWYLSQRRKLGFFLAALGSLGWLVCSILIESLPGMVANFIYIALNVRGWNAWKKSEEGGACQEPQPG